MQLFVRSKNQTNLVHDRLADIAKDTVVNHWQRKIFYIGRGGERLIHKTIVVQGRGILTSHQNFLSTVFDSWF